MYIESGIWIYRLLSSKFNLEYFPSNIFKKVAYQMPLNYPFMPFFAQVRLECLLNVHSGTVDVFHFTQFSTLSVSTNALIIFFYKTFYIICFNVGMNKFKLLFSKTLNMFSFNVGINTFKLL